MKAEYYSCGFSTFQPLGAGPCPIPCMFTLTPDTTTLRNTDTLAADADAVDEALAASGELVLHSRRHLGVGLAGDHAVRFEVA